MLSILPDSNSSGIKPGPFQFGAYWGSHDILIRHEGRKGLQHPAVGELELTYQSTEIPLVQRAWHDLTF